MDWFSWLSKTGIERSLVYEYGTAFSYNELGEDDISYFNHEFLQSIGVTVAKHRLEIIKLARKDGGKGVNLSTSHRPVSRLVGTIKNTKASISEYVKKWILRRDKDGAFVFPRPCTYGDRWKASMLRRNQKLLPDNRSRMLLVCNGSPMVLSSTPCIDSFSSPVVYAFSKEENKIGKENGGGGGGHWSSGVEETRWHCMFHNLKPHMKGILKFHPVMDFPLFKWRFFSSSSAVRNAQGLSCAICPVCVKALWLGGSCVHVILFAH